MRGATAALAVAALVLAGCGGASSGPGAPGTLTVSAAASLTDAFTELEARFEAANPDVDVVLNFGPSSALAGQILSGAPVDVFASADLRQMDRVREAGLVAGRPEVFATNVLRIAVPPGNPEDIGGLADLNRPGLALVVCAPQVPCGAATQQAARAAGVRLTPVSEEPDVRSVLSKVTSGNADAGLVYRTDIRSAGEQVQGVDFPESAAAVNEYPIAALAGSGPPAAAFLDLVRGAEGRAVLEAAGFGDP